MLKRLVDAFWLFGWMLYVLAGVALVPFHGDESTVIYMSKDYAYLFQQGDTARMRYAETPLSSEEQDLRLLNGPVTKYLIGVAWDLRGYTLDEINEQWHWGFDWYWNISNGHSPSEDLLQTARWPSAFLLAGSVALIFYIALFAFDRPAAYLTSTFY